MNILEKIFRSAETAAENCDLNGLILESKTYIEDTYNIILDEEEIQVLSKIAVLSPIKNVSIICKQFAQYRRYELLHGFGPK